MKILLVVATKSEIIENKFKDCDVMVTGVGMVNTTFSLTKRLSEKSYDLVINIGVAGSFNSAIKIGDVVEVIEDNFSEIGFEDGNSFSEFTNFRIENSFKVNENSPLIFVVVPFVLLKITFTPINGSRVSSSITTPEIFTVICDKADEKEIRSRTTNKYFLIF